MFLHRLILILALSWTRQPVHATRGEVSSGFPKIRSIYLHNFLLFRRHTSLSNSVWVFSKQSLSWRQNVSASHCTVVLYLEYKYAFVFVLIIHAFAFVCCCWLCFIQVVQLYEIINTTICICICIICTWIWFVFVCCCWLCFRLSSCAKS